MSERIKFTHNGVAGIAPRPARFVVWDQSHPGLGLRVTPHGTKTFVIAYRFDGKPRLHSIGNVAGVPLREAFNAYHEASAKIERAKAARGRGETPSPDLDPAGSQRRNKDVRRAAESVEDVWLAYLAKKRPTLRPKTIGEYSRIMQNDVLPNMGATRARDVRPKNVKMLLNKIGPRGIVMANRTRALLAALFAHAVDELVIDSNPVKLVRRIKGEKPRERALAEEPELRGFFAALREMAAPDPAKRALQMILATGVRPGEAMRMRWSDLDETTNTWTIPAEFVKTKRQHVVPLSPFASALVAESKAAGVLSDWIFPDASGEQRLATLVLSNALRAAETALAKHECAAFRPHDLRRTCRTWLSKLGVDETVAERVIGHESQNRLVATYNRHDYLPEKRAALELWGATLTAMRAGNNVVAIGKVA